MPMAFFRYKFLMRKNANENLIDCFKAYISCNFAEL